MKPDTSLLHVHHMKCRNNPGLARHLYYDGEFPKDGIPVGNLFQYIHKFDLSCHSKGPRRFPKLKIRTQLIFCIASACFIFPSMSQEILEGDIMSAKMSHPAGKILWLIRVAFWGDTVQKECWMWTVFQNGRKQLTFVHAAQCWEQLSEHSGGAHEICWLGGECITGVGENVIFLPSQTWYYWEQSKKRD